jgi:hypothetical protein
MELNGMLGISEDCATYLASGTTWALPEGT